MRSGACTAAASRILEPLCRRAVEIEPEQTRRRASYAFAEAKFDSCAGWQLPKQIKNLFPRTPAKQSSRYATRHFTRLATAVPPLRSGFKVNSRTDTPARSTW